MQKGVSIFIVDIVINVPIFKKFIYYLTLFSIVMYYGTQTYISNCINNYFFILFVSFYIFLFINLKVYVIYDKVLNNSCLARAIT